MEEDRLPGAERPPGEAAGGLPARQHAVPSEIVLRRGRGRRVAAAEMGRRVRQVPGHGHGEGPLIGTVLLGYCDSFGTIESCHNK